LKKKETIILGIDPGTRITGYGIIKSYDNRLELIAIGIIELYKLENHYIKLKKIFDRTLQLIKTYKVDEFSVESTFYGKNIQSTLKLGRAQGVSIAAALSCSIPVFEYAPRKIKQAITGNGNASKEQVASLLEKFLFIKNLKRDLDATDGLAVAVCHQFQNKMINKIENNSVNSWKEFINKNPKRVKF